MVNWDTVFWWVARRDHLSGLIFSFSTKENKDKDRKKVSAFFFVYSIDLSLFYTTRSIHIHSCICVPYCYSLTKRYTIGKKIQFFRKKNNRKKYNWIFHSYRTITPPMYMIDSDISCLTYPCELTLYVQLIFFQLIW
jgi:hypothetical protein